MKRRATRVEKTNKKNEFTLGGIRDKPSELIENLRDQKEQEIRVLVECELQNPFWIKCLSAFIKEMGTDDTFLSLCFTNNMMYMWEETSSSAPPRCFVAVDCRKTIHYCYEHDHPMIRISVPYRNYATTFENYNKQNDRTSIIIYAEDTRYYIRFEQSKTQGHQHANTTQTTPISSIDPYSGEHSKITEYFDDFCLDEFKEVLMNQLNTLVEFEYLKESKSSQASKIIEQKTFTNRFDKVIFDKFVESTQIKDSLDSITADNRPKFFENFLENDVNWDDLSDELKLYFVGERKEHMTNCVYESHVMKRHIKFMMPAKNVKMFVSEVNKDAEGMEVRLIKKTNSPVFVSHIAGTGTIKEFDCANNGLTAFKSYNMDMEEDPDANNMVATAIMSKITSACDTDENITIMVTTNNVVIVKVKNEELTMKFNVTMYE